MNTEASEDFYSHPIFNPLELNLDTPMRQEMKDEITRWLWTGTTGGIVYGQARIGKTTALRSLCDDIKLRNGKLVPSFYVSIPGRDQRTVTTVLRHLCDSANLYYNRASVSDSLSKMFLHHVLDITKMQNCNHVLLMVDEMQRLKSEQFNVFAELYDHLKLFGVLLTVLFVGNDPECWNVIERLNTDRYAHIRGRFLVHVHPYTGIKSEGVLRSCLKEYDTKCYPENGPSYTEYFLPDAVAKGFRLESCATELWRVFSEYRKELNLESWGMQYFTSTVNTLLSDMLRKHGTDEFCEEMIHECIKVSGLVPSIVRKGVL